MIYRYVINLIKTYCLLKLDFTGFKSDSIKSLMLSVCMSEENPFFTQLVKTCYFLIFMNIRFTGIHDL